MLLFCDPEGIDVGVSAKPQQFGVHRITLLRFRHGCFHSVHKMLQVVDRKTELGEGQVELLKS